MFLLWWQLRQWCNELFLVTGLTLIWEYLNPVFSQFTLTNILVKDTIVLYSFLVVFQLLIFKFEKQTKLVTFEDKITNDCEKEPLF